MAARFHLSLRRALMAISPNLLDDQADEDTSLVDTSDGCSVGIEEMPLAPRGTEWTGPRCDKCDAPMKSGVVTICRSCGWYASLGTFVEVDPNWETETDSQEAALAEPQRSHVRVWLDMMPRWAWIILASVLVVIIESVVVRFVTPAGSSLRTMWSLSQLGIGLLVAICCHVFNFLVLATEDTDFGVIDLVLKPVKLWAKAVRNLPTRLWVADAAVCGLVAALMSVLVIGGLPYERLWDWGFKEPVKQNLMGAVMDRAKQLDSRNGADNLEDAIGDFAGTGELEGEDLPKQPEKPRERTDCVILGYNVDRDGRLSSLVLGTAHKSALIFAGRVQPEMPEEERGKLLQQLKVIHVKQSFITIESEATWVQPKYTCRVTYGEKLKNGKLRDIKWDEMLGSINSGKE
jgi:hypothetical protein